MYNETWCCTLLCTLPSSCRAALAAEEEQHRLCQKACEAAEAAYGQACCRTPGGQAFLQAQQGLQACVSQLLQVASSGLPTSPCEHLQRFRYSSESSAGCACLRRCAESAVYAQAEAERRQAELELKRARSQTAAVQKAIADMDTKASSAKGAYPPRGPFPASQGGPTALLDQAA